MAGGSSSVAGRERSRVPSGRMRRGTLALMAVCNAVYLCAAPVFWFFWTQRSEFALPPWAEDAAGFASGPLPALALAAAWAAAAVMFSRGRRQAGGTAFNTICSLGALAAVSGMLALASSGLDG